MNSPFNSAPSVYEHYRVSSINRQSLFNFCIDKSYEIVFFEVDGSLVGLHL